MASIRHAAAPASDGGTPGEARTGLHAGHAGSAPPGAAVHAPGRRPRVRARRPAGVGGRARAPARGQPPARALAALRFVYPATAVVVDWLVCGRVLTPLQMAGLALIGSAPWTLPAPPGATGGGRPIANRPAAWCGKARAWGRQSLRRGTVGREEGPIGTRCAGPAASAHGTGPGPPRALHFRRDIQRAAAAASSRSRSPSQWTAGSARCCASDHPSGLRAIHQAAAASATAWSTAASVPPALPGCCRPKAASSIIFTGL